MFDNTGQRRLLDLFLKEDQERKDAQKTPAYLEKRRAGRSYLTLQNGRLSISRS